MTVDEPDDTMARAAEVMRDLQREAEQGGLPVDGVADPAQVMQDAARAMKAMLGQPINRRQRRAVARAARKKGR